MRKEINNLTVEEKFEELKSNGFFVLEEDEDGDASVVLVYDDEGFYCDSGQCYPDRLSEDEVLNILSGYSEDED